MKSKKLELDVDFIGDQSSSLTKEEEKALKVFFKKKKIISEKQKRSPSRKTIKSQKVTE